MSTGRAITCDQCGVVKPYTYEDYNEFNIPEGWIRITARKPNRYSWGGESLSDVEDAGDFCSLSCASTWLYNIKFSE